MTEEIWEGDRLFINEVLSVPQVGVDAETGEVGHAFIASVNGRQHTIFLTTRTSYELLRYLGGHPRRWWRREK